MNGVACRFKALIPAGDGEGGFVLSSPIVQNALSPLAFTG